VTTVVAIALSLAGFGSTGTAPVAPATIDAVLVSVPAASG